jgi:hypothetical protein
LGLLVARDDLPFVCASVCVAAVLRWVADLDFLVVAIGLPNPEALFHLPGSATRHAPFLTSRQHPR